MRQSDYVIEGGRHGKERLSLLSDVFRPTTRRLLARAGLSPGMRCLDVGCGGGDLTLDLARRVGPDGSVLGIDFDATIVALARADAEARNLAFLAADARTIGGLGPFDLVYARFLLTHVPDPDAVLSTMIRLTRPGGSVVVEDIDFAGQFSYPECPAFRRYLTLYSEATRRLGGDPEIGRRLAAMFRTAGMPRASTRVIQLAHERGRGKTLSLVTLRADRAGGRASGAGDGRGDASADRRTRGVHQPQRHDDRPSAHLPGLGIPARCILTMRTGEDDLAPRLAARPTGR